MKDKKTITNNPYIDLVREALSKEQKVCLFFSGSSMLPALKEGMQVTVNQILPHQVRLGDLILYRKAEQMIIHRVVGINHEAGEVVFTSRGDNQSYLSGEAVQPRNLIGIVRNAFSQMRPETDVLCADNILGRMYVIINSLIEMGRKLEEVSPRFIRQTVRFGFRCIFFALVKWTHFVYKGIRNGLLIFKRPNFFIARNI